MEEEINPLTNPWVKETLEDVMDTTRHKVLNWCGKLIEMGMDEENLKYFTNIFKTHISTIYDDMIDEVTNFQEELCRKIESLLQKSELLCKSLHIKLPGYGSKGFSLFEEQRLLEKRIARYEEMVEEKRKEVAALNKQQIQLCDALGRTPKKIPESPLPTPEFINEFRNYLESLESEKFTREETFLEMKTSVMEIVQELKFIPTLDFEKAVISPDDSLFVVSDANMKELNNFYDSLKQQFEETKDEIASLRERIKFLWELLAEDLKNYDEFLQKHTGNSLNTLEALRLEVKRCENLKRANIEVFVKRLRQELISLWEKCHFTDEERNFEYFHTDLYTEDLLTLHDMEIQKMNKYYNQNSELFNLLEKREELWTKWLILDQRATDRNRYNNRGGQLLKEEKERNALSKHIPKIEEKLLQLAKDFETRVGKQFLSWGETVDTIIFQAKEKHEQDKKLKLSARKLQRDKTLTPGKSMLGLSTGTQKLATFGTTSSATKRKPVTPLFSAKRMRIFSENNGNVPTSAPPELHVNGHPIGPSRYSIERAKRIEKCRRFSQRRLQKHSEKENTLERSAEYDVFEKEIQNKESCRSTIFFDAGGFNTPLAVPLPLTPHRLPAGTTNTPHRTPGASSSKSHTPRTTSKFSVAPSLKRLF